MSTLTAGGEQITADWQMEYRGLLIGDGTEFDFVRIEGLLDIQEMHTSDRPRLRRHGNHPGDDFLGGRTVTLTMEIYGASQSELKTNVSRFLSAFRPGVAESPMAIRVPGVGDEVSLIFARPRRRTSAINTTYAAGLASVVVEMHASDPRIYSLPLNLLSASPEIISAKLSWPLTWPLVWTSSTNTGGGSIVAVNAGNFPVAPIIRFDGPVTDPRIENTVTSEEIRLNGTIGEGDYIVVDTSRRTILLNNETSRYSRLDPDSKWFDLYPGPNNLIYRSSVSTTATCTVAWRSAWV